MIAALLLSIALTATGSEGPTEFAEPIAPQRLASQPLDPAREARVQKLAKLLRCPVCQGLSIADSPSSSARAQLDKVRELVQQGRSDQEIFSYFEDRWGEFALLEPKSEGANVVLWIGPVVLIGLGLLIIVGMSRKQGTPGLPAKAPEAAPEDDYLRRVRADLER